MLYNRAAMIGEVVGNFRITDKLATGGMGVVYKAEHLLIGKKAAVKLLKRALSENRDVVERFFQEARATTLIRHPGIVDIYDFGYHGDNRAFIVMEYLEGETLKARLHAQGCLSVEDAVRLVRSVAGAVGAAHAQGIVHRDLKPDNIFLVPDADMPGGERVKVLDFGLAKLTNQGASMGTQAGIVLGTPTYMSPEQCDGMGNIDHRADQYALGCILYQLLCGQPPFTADSTMDLLKAHRRQPPPPPSSVAPGIPAGVEGVVLRLLAKTPEERYADMDHLREALDGCFLSSDNIDTLVGAEPVVPVHPPAPMPGPYSQTSSVSSSSGQVMRSMAASMGSDPHARPVSQSHPSVSAMRPVRLPSIPGHRRRSSPVFWALGAVASILIGFGIVYAVGSLDQGEPEVILPGGNTEARPAPVHHRAAAHQAPATFTIAQAAEPPAHPGAPGETGGHAPDAQAGDDPRADEELIEMEPDPVQPASGDAPGPGDDPGVAPDVGSDVGSDVDRADEEESGRESEDAPGAQGQGAAPAAGDAPAHFQVHLRLVPETATVAVDGEPRAGAPLLLAPRERAYRIQVSAEGYKPKQVWVRADRDRSLRVELERDRAGIDL